MSPDALLPPSLLAISRLLQRPALDLLLLHDDDAPPQCCQRYDCPHPDFVYKGPAWVVRITRQELRKPRSPEYAGLRVASPTFKSLFRAQDGWVNDVWFDTLPF